MAESDSKSPAAEFVSRHPELREKMAESENFKQLKQSKALQIDNEQLYVVQGDVLGEEADLYVDSIVRGSNSATEDRIARDLFLELDEGQKQLIINHFTKR